MPESYNWSFPPELQPQPASTLFDLDRTLGAVVRLTAKIPDDAFTANTLGTERGGNAVVIRDNGMMVTIGYLVTEAESVWITTNDGQAVPGHVLAYDFATGLGLVLPLGPLRVTPIPIGTSAGIGVDDDVYVVGHGGRMHALKAQVFARREFAGYWEYLLDEALFTAPPHPEWSGAALLDHEGKLVGIGSLFVQEGNGDEVRQGNMFVPIDVLTPILEDLLRFGQARHAPRPWLGMYTSEERGVLIVGGVAENGPAARAGVRRGDAIVDVAGEHVGNLADMFRRVWKLGPAGTQIPLTVARGDARIPVTVKSADRGDFLKKPSLQ